MFSFRSSRYAPLPGAGTHVLAIAAAIGLGAALMYFLDPDSGRRRRARLGIAPERGAAQGNGSGDDTLLAERVRAALGRVVEDPDAIDVRVRDGCVILKGPVTAAEIGEIVACAGRVRGVQSVENRLSISSGSVPTAPH